jgi:hypothetical protein
MTPMSEWIDVSIYAALIVSYWFVFAGWAQAMTLEMVADRNADWLTANHEQAATLLRGRWIVGSTWFLWSCYAWGTFSLIALLARQLGLWPMSLVSLSTGNQPWEALKDAHSSLLIIGLLYYFGVVIVSTRLIHRDVPLAERRRATLTPRTVNDFVPQWFSIATYLLVGIHLLTWVIVGALGLSSTPGFWVRFAGPLSFSIIALLIGHAMVNRRVSDFLGFNDRRIGVRFAFGSLIYVQFMFGLRLYGDVVDPSLEVDRVMHLSLVMMLVMAILALAIFGRSDQRRLNPALSPH